MVLTKSKTGRGILYDKTEILDDPLDRETSERIYGADSIAIVFGKQRVQGHYGFTPIGNSLTFFCDYKSEGNTKRFIITEQNFNYVVPCDGNCYRT